MSSIDTAIEKQSAVTDKALTKAFNRLIKTPKITEKAVINNDGRLIQNVGLANSFSEYCTSFGNSFINHVPALTGEQIVQNKAYQTYRAMLNDQDYDVSIGETWGNNGATGLSQISGTIKTVTVGCAASGIPPVMLAGAIGGVFCAVIDLTGKDHGAGFEMHIKKRAPIKAPLLIECDNLNKSDDAELLNEIQQPKIDIPVIR